MRWVDLESEVAAVNIGPSTYGVRFIPPRLLNAREGDGYLLNSSRNPDL